MIELILNNRQRYSIFDLMVLDVKYWITGKSYSFDGFGCGILNGFGCEILDNRQICTSVDVNDLAGEEVFVTEQGVPNSKKDDAAQVNTAITTVSTASTIPVSVAIITEDEITLAQALAELKSVKPKDKGKGIMVKEPLKMKKKDQISFDEQEAIRLQAEFDEEVRLAREKDEANQKVDEDKETAELQSLMKVIPDEEEVAVDAIPLATKPPSIMLRSFDREDLETLWKLVKAKHMYTSTLCEVSKSACLYVGREEITLTPATITEMLNKKLQADHWNEMCYQLLKLITKKLKNQ
ncbi:hypothetical protein Tco_0121322 [Tanacetum coccineum]